MHGVAGAIVGIIREHGRVEVQDFGTAAVHRTIIAIVFANEFLQVMFHHLRKQGLFQQPG